ncbi:MAG TPA: EAL domain-containing protein [Chiayiivirga sp.]|nr:EAL domain-containing protein [Chiayiivirga sp.]
MLAALPVVVSAAVRSHYFRTLGGEQGLAQGRVMAMLQDHRGFVWVATRGELQRFDGYAFRRLDELIPKATSPGTVLALAEDEDERLFLGTRDAGLYLLDAERAQLHTAFDPTTATAKPGTRIDALVFQSGVGLWVGSSTGVGLYLTDTGVYHPVLDFPAAADSDEGEFVSAMTLDPDGQLWVATSRSVHRIDTRQRVALRFSDRPALALAIGPSGELWIGARAGLYRKARGASTIERVWPLRLPETGPQRCCEVQAVAQAPDGAVWLAVKEGNVWRFDPNLSEAEIVPSNPWIEGMLVESDVRRLMIDRSNLLWLGGSSRGVSTTSLDSVAFRSVFDLDPSHDTLSGNVVTSIFEGADGILWLGTEGGLRSYDPGRDHFRASRNVVAPESHGASLRISGIVEADDGDLWLSTQSGLYRFNIEHWRSLAIDLGTGAEAVDVRTMARLRDGTLWLARAGRGLLIFDPVTGQTTAMPPDPTRDGALRQANITSIVQDSRVRVWLGSRGDGLSLFDPNGTQFQNFRHQVDQDDSLSSDMINAIYETRDGTIWVAGDRGVDQVVEGTDGQMRFIPLPLGDVHAAVQALIEDGNGVLWISTNNDLLRIDRGDGSVARFGANNGLRALTTSTGTAIRLSDGHLVFGGIRGLTLVDPARAAASRFDPPIALTWTAMGMSAPTTVAGHLPKIEVPFEQRLVQMGFAALDFTAPDQNLFSYRLEGFDDAFTTPDPRPWVLYTNLAPGRYTLQVRASNHSGIWSSKHLQVPITILPPWWRSTLAYLIYGLMALIAVLLLFWFLRQRAVQRRVLLQQVKEREDQLRLSLWGAGDSFWDWDLRSNHIERIGTDELLHGPSAETVSVADWRENAIHPDDLPRVQQLLHDHISGRSEAYESEHRIRNARGEWTWVRARGKVVGRDADGNPLRMAGTAHDIGAKRQAERERRIASEVLRSMGEAVAVLDLNFRFASVNPAFLRITALREQDVLGMPDSLLESTRHPPEFFRRMHESLESKGHYRGEVWLHRADGDEFLSWVEMAEILDEAGVRTHFVAVFNDITDKKRIEQELRYLANYDTLTGLPNRSLLSERLARAVVRARRTGNKVAVLFLDLDHFKLINDSLGHAAGDRILKATAARLLGVVGSSDTVARLGGDEFTIVMEDVQDNDGVIAMANAVIASFGAPVLHEAHGEVTVSPSIGISLYPDHGQVPVDLLKFADAAMYRAKDRGRNTFQFFDESMDAEIRRRANMTAALRRAMDRHELHLAFQPRQSLFDDRIVGVEALLRWTSEEFGSVPPSVFIPLAEENGMILPIGEWVMEQACQTLCQWRAKGSTVSSIAVNVSVLQMARGDLPATVARVLASTGLPASSLELEITESVAMANAEQTIAVLRELKRLGVGIVIDDFGTGYSSLVYLKRFPIDTLKIDREFVGDLTRDPDDEAIVTTIISMAHSLGLNVVAEGVETTDQLGYLRERNCDEIQGYLLSRPLTEADCFQFMLDWAARLEQSPAS